MNSTLDERLVSEEEGRRSKVYKDSRGYWSIGVGCCVDEDVVGAGLCDAAIDAQLDYDLQVARRDAAALDGFEALNDVQKAAIVSMCLQLGTLHDWTHFRDAIAAKHYAAAEAAGLDSAWAKQTPLRAKRELAMIATGKWIDHGKTEPDSSEPTSHLGV